MVFSGDLIAPVSGIEGGEAFSVRVEHRLDDLFVGTWGDSCVYGDEQHVSGQADEQDHQRNEAIDGS